jgi:molybdate transport system substrate-binding protein
MRRIRLALLAVLALTLFASACGNDSTTATTTTGTVTVTVTGDLTVFGAASLTESFKAIGAAFEKDNPGAKVTFNFGASSTLVTQITQGAPVDVYASADAANMKKLTDAGGAVDPTTFATNRLQIIVGKGNPKGITTVADLAKPGLTVVTCGPEVPIGKYAADVFTKAGVTVTPKSLEADVKGIVNKVTLGEADAGIVYATDVKAAGDKAVGVAIPDNLNTIATYPIVTTKDAKNGAAAEAFVKFVAGSTGRGILVTYGFTAP